MTTKYAILGATGNCGRSLIEILLKTPDVQVNAFCRNKLKLGSQIPDVLTSKKVQVFEGSIQDTPVITECIRDTHAVFLCVSTNTNIPGCRMAQDTAISVIESLKGLQESTKDTQKEFHAPKLVLLSSNTLEDDLSLHTPAIIRQILLRSASNVYQDLRETEKFLRAQEDWVKTVFIKPGGLSVDVQRGHKLSLTDEKSPLSYLDLAAGMIEAANDPDGQWDMKNVGVMYTNGEAKWPNGVFMAFSMGLLRHYLPFLHPYLPSTGPY